MLSWNTLYQEWRSGLSLIEPAEMLAELRTMIAATVCLRVYFAIMPQLPSICASAKDQEATWR
jgi:hypothetical protein